LFLIPSNGELWGFIWIALFLLAGLVIQFHDSQHHDEIGRSGLVLQVQAGCDGRLRIVDESAG
jgi:hypothetical protein